MGKTRDLFKKIRNTKGTFHAKMGSIKDRNGMDRYWYLKQYAQKQILRRGAENTQKNYTKKDLHNPDNHDSVISHLEQDPGM